MIDNTLTIMENTKLNELISTFTQRLKEDIEHRVKTLEKNYESEYNRLRGPIDEISFQMRDWKRTMESLEEDIKKESFTVAKVQWEAKLEIINHMDSVLERELGRFGYTSVFEDR